jgi:TonB family protein
MPARLAGESYAAMRASHDGALVEAAGSDQLALRVPIAADHRAEIELELALPPIPAVAIDPGGQTVRRAELRRPGAPRRIWDDLAEPWTIALPRASAPPARPGALSPPAGVSAAMSLLVGDPLMVVFGPATSMCGGAGGARSVRRIVRQHHPQLRYCYMRVAQWNPQLAGTAVLHFVIAEDGRVRSSSVDSDLGDAGIERCLADEVARWEFGAAPGGGEIQVNYPVTFRIAR